MNELKELFNEYLEMNSYEKEIILFNKVLNYIEKNNIKTYYSEEFFLELKKFVNIYLSYKEKNINLINLLINTYNRDYSIKADVINSIKQIILSRFNTQDLNYLRINHIKLQNIIKERKELLEAYKEFKFVDNKTLQSVIKDKSLITNYFILKTEYEHLNIIQEKYDIFHKIFKSVLLKEHQYNKPVYIGLKHLQQNETYMEGPYFKNIKCPKCGGKIIHLLEGITKDGSIYTCDNLCCKFFINGNFFLKKGQQDLIKYFHIKNDINKKRNSSHHKIFLTLKQSQNKNNYIELETEGFIFRYEYNVEEYTIGLKLVEIEYNLEVLNLNDFYCNKYKILNFLNNFFEEHKF